MTGRDIARLGEGSSMNFKPHLVARADHKTLKSEAGGQSVQASATTSAAMATRRERLDFIFAGMASDCLRQLAEKSSWRQNLNSKGLFQFQQIGVA